MWEDLVTETGKLEKGGEPDVCRSQPVGTPKDLAGKTQVNVVFVPLGKTHS